MKIALGLLVGVLSSTSAMPTSAPEFQFSGEVQADQLMSTAFIQPVPAGYVRILDVKPGLRLELAAPREDGSDAVTHVRLLKEDGDSYRILHEANITGASDIERSFTYRVCGSEVTFFTPAPYKTPHCAGK